MKHELKTWPDLYDDVASGAKTFEVRSTDDREYSLGDVLELKEYDPETRKYSGMSCLRKITYVLEGDDAVTFGVIEGYAVLGVVPIEDEDEEIEPPEEIREERDEAMRQLYQLTRPVPGWQVDLDLDEDENPDSRGCLRCGGTWDLGEKEDHEPGCGFGQVRDWLKSRGLEDMMLKADR